MWPWPGHGKKRAAGYRLSGLPLSPVSTGEPSSGPGLEGRSWGASAWLVVPGLPCPSSSDVAVGGRWPVEEEEARGAKAGRRRACLMSFHGVFLQWCWHAVVFCTTANLNRRHRFSAENKYGVSTRRIVSVEKNQKLRWNLHSEKPRAGLQNAASYLNTGSALKINC